MASAWGRAFGWAACIVSIVLLAAALLSGARAAAVEVRVTGAVVRIAAVAGRPAAGYLTVRTGIAPLIIVGATSPLAERIEVHGTTMVGGIMRMSPLSEVRIGAGRSGGFMPGGNHLMIFGLRSDIKPGVRVPIVLRVRDGATIEVEAVAVAAGAALPGSTHRGHGAH